MDCGADRGGFEVNGRGRELEVVNGFDGELVEGVTVTPLSRLRLLTNDNGVDWQETSGTEGEGSSLKALETSKLVGIQKTMGFSEDKGNPSCEIAVELGGIKVAK